MKESYLNICDDLAGSEDPKVVYKKINKLNVAQLNVNSLRNKFDFLEEQIQHNIVTLMTSRYVLIISQ